ncbi:transposase [Polyangium spumosum]|uniref:transposase n=1 Tax=Polyangium spumosum TaxID=889282 RepID=UPI00308420E0
MTNHPITTLEDACLVVFGYTQRWRIEEFHRTWKQGGCNVEATQLQTSEHVKRWATLLAAVAMRIERLKYLSRNQPDLPATEELSRYEIDALILKRRKRKNPGIPDGILTIGIATQWIAELGGYTGKSSGGPPGSITIGRGLERLAPVAETLQQLDEAGLLR